MKKILMALAFSIAILTMGLAATGTVQLDASAEAKASDQLIRESLVLPWQPDFLVDPESLVEATRITYGFCTQTCAPCYSNADCPPFFGFPQRCHEVCP